MNRVGSVIVADIYATRFGEFGNGKQVGKVLVRGPSGRIQLLETMKRDGADSLGNVVNPTRL